MIYELERLKKTLEPLNVKLKKKIGGDSSAQTLDIALLDFLMKHTSAPDRELARDLVLGMPLTGEISYWLSYTCSPMGEIALYLLRPLTGQLI